MQLPYVHATGFTLVKEIGAFRIRGGLAIALARPGSVSSTAVIFIARDRLSPSQGDKIQSDHQTHDEFAQNFQSLRPGCTFFTIEVAGRCVELIFHDASIGKFRADQYGAVPAPWTAVDRDTAVVAVAAQCGSVFEEECSIPELIRVAKRVVMEILGFGLQSETQYLEGILREFSSGNKVETSLRFGSTLSPLFMDLIKEVDTKEETRWIHVSALSPLLFPLSDNLILNNSWRINARQTFSVEFNSLRNRNLLAKKLQTACLLCPHCGPSTAKLRSQHSTRSHWKVCQSEVRRPEGVLLPQGCRGKEVLARSVGGAACSRRFPRCCCIQYTATTAEAQV
jgi:hypothetical protein